MIGERGEDFARVVDPADIVAGARRSFVEAELAAVMGERFVTRKMKEQITDRLVRHAIGSTFTRHDFLTGERLGSGKIAGENESSCLDDGLTGSRDVVVVGTAGPDRVFVERKTFLRRTTKNHRAETAVAERKRLGPGLRGRGIP